MYVRLGEHDVLAYVRTACEENFFAHIIIKMFAVLNIPAADQKGVKKFLEALQVPVCISAHRT